jgi:uncharacterized protein YjbK
MRKSFLENEYFDTDSLDILNKSFMLRVRISDDRYDLTLKIKGDNGDLEYHQQLEKEQYESFKKDNIFPSGEIEEILNQNDINVQSIKYQNSLYCIRYEFFIDDYIIVIDKNKYDNNTDFNIEVESNSLIKSKEKILELSRIFSFTLKDEYLTKYRRALLKRN